jgi:hypothetical protein
MLFIIIFKGFPTSVLTPAAAIQVTIVLNECLLSFRPVLSRNARP